MGRDLRAGRVELIHDPLPVDADRQRPANLRVIPWRERIRHRQVQDVRLRLADQAQVGIALDRRVVRGAREGDSVYVARLELEKALGTLCRPPQDGRLVWCHSSVVGVVALVNHRVTGDPLDERVRAGSDRVAERCATGPVHQECQLR